MRGPLKSYGRTLWGVICMSALVFAAPAQAQPEQRTIEATAGQDWDHQNSGMTMPARLGGFDRQYIRDLTDDGLDVYGQYYGKDGQTRLTLFFYRAAVNSVPLWFDAANQALRGNVKLLPGASEYLSSAFTPPGQSEASGLMAVYSTSGNEFKSTGVAMLPLNGWLVKIRFTSAELSAEELAASLMPILHDIGWPEEIVSGPAATVILPCENALKLSDRIKRIKPTMTDALSAGILNIPVDDTADGEEPGIYCRDPQDFGPFSIYRAGGSEDGYLMPLGDAGRAASVHANRLGGLTGGSREPRFTPVMMRLDQNIIFPDLDKLPTPGVLLSATGDGAAISAVTTWPPSSGSTITVNVPADEDQ
ncbi:conserved exported hypothetical protein [Sphingorhabdus sp. 109]|nr:conserved exported hypothetical protein [Sphingorhabdus sp. 109]